MISNAHQLDIGFRIHARGEKIDVEASASDQTESSPRTWGKVADLLRNNAIDGIIPTHVGKSIPGQSSQFSRRDHPHARGEKTFTEI